MLSGQATKVNFFDTKPLRDLDDHQALLRVESDFKQAKTNKSTMLLQARRYLHIYKALDSPDEAINESTGEIEDDIGMYSNTYLPVGAAICDTAIAQLYNFIFSTVNYMEIEADDFQDGFFARKVTAHLIKRHKEMRYRQKVYQVIQQACCFHYGVTGTRWLMEPGYQPQPIKRTENVKLGPITIPRQVVKSEALWVPNKVDRSDMFVLDYFNCYHDWTSKDGLEDSRFFFDERDVPLEDLISQSEHTHPWGRYKNIDKVVATALKAMEEDTKEISDPAVAREFVNSRRVTVKRCWTKHQIIEFCQGYIIRRSDCYDWALQIWKIFDEPGVFGGMGVLQRFERNQLDINASMNARRNLQNLISNPFGVIDQSLVGESDGAPTVYPGWMGVSRGGSPKDKIWMYTPGQNSNVDAMLDVATQITIAEKQSGFPDPAQGHTTKGRTTATEIREVSAGVATRAHLIAQQMEANCIEPINLQLFFLEQTFLSRKESFKYNGEYGDEFFVIDPADYMWNSIPRFMAKGTTSALQDAIQTQQFMIAIDKTAQMPVEADWPKIATEMWRQLYPKNYNQFIKDPTIPTHNLPPQLENQLMANGQRVEVSPANDHQEHSQVHAAMKNTPDYQLWPQRLKLIFEDHEQQHQQAQQPQQAQQGVPGMQDSSDPARGMRPGAVA